MSDMTFLLVTFVLCAAITIVSLFGSFVTSPVLSIFSLVFLVASALVAHEIWERR